MHCLREPATALMSLLSVALSSVTGKHMHDSILGGIFTPLKFKIVLDMGYTSLCWPRRNDIFILRKFVAQRLDLRGHLLSFISAYLIIAVQ